MRRKPITIKDPRADYEIKIVGDRPTPLRDFYHALLKAPWWATIAAISATFLAANAVFAALFVEVGGVSHAAPASFKDAFFFSVQTMGTIGNVIVVAESLTSLLLTALATGLVFAKFSRSTARFVFSKHVVISPLNGVPTLAFRLGNQRGNQLVDAQIRLVMIRTEQTSEGKPFYKMLDLHPTRARALSLSRSWNVLHIVDAGSPLHGETPASTVLKEIELQVLVIGIDDITMQTVHTTHRYFTKDILWGARMADVLTEIDSGHLVLDLRKFHDVEPTEPTPDFPYP